MEAIVERCAGLDVHLDTVVACILYGDLDKKPNKEIKTFSTTTKGLICQTSIVDCGYQGPVHLILTNCSVNTFTFNKDDRLVSMITYKYLEDDLEEVVEFTEKTDRGTNGLGSSGN